MRPGLETRLAAAERQLAGMLTRAGSELASQWLAELSIEELRVLEQIAARLEPQGLMLSVRPIPPSREELAAMSPSERADAYRRLLREGGPDA
jgi:hypothetical protein